MRSFRAENVSLLVKQVLDLERESAAQTLSELRERYPILITRWKTMTTPASGSDAGNAQQAGTDGKPAATAAKLPAANSTQKK